MQVFYIKNTAAETSIDQLLQQQQQNFDMQAGYQNIKPRWKFSEL